MTVLTRRDFLKLSGISLVGVVSSCSADTSLKPAHNDIPDDSEDKDPEANEHEEESPLPDYYTKHVTSKTEEIKANISATRHGISFPFITDMHMAHNQGQSSLILKELLDKTAMPFAISGGDWIGAFGAEEELQAQVDKAHEFTDTVGKSRFFGVRGNHDLTIKYSQGDGAGTEGSGKTLPMTACYDALTRHSEPYATALSDGMLYYCIDHKASKTRIIMLDTSYQDEAHEECCWSVWNGVPRKEMEWLLERLKEKDGWHFIIVSHVPTIKRLPDQRFYYEGGKNYKDLQRLLIAFRNHGEYQGATNTENDCRGLKADFRASTSELVCHISGHWHMDLSGKDNGVLAILTGCDALYNDDTIEVRKPGTINEHLIDVFTIDYDQKTIRTVRVGAGSNREWSY